MKSLRRMTKADVLLNMFDDVGVEIGVDEVCETTGIKNYNTLKGFFSYIRKSKHVDDESRIDVRVKDGMCRRVK